MEIFTFGKYKGEKVMDIIETNPEYVLWCGRTIEWFELTVEQAKELSRQMEIITKIRNRRATKWLDDMYSEYEPYDGWGEDMRACFDPNY